MLSEVRLQTVKSRSRAMISKLQVDFYGTVAAIMASCQKKGSVAGLRSRRHLRSWTWTINQALVLDCPERMAGW